MTKLIKENDKDADVIPIWEACVIKPDKPKKSEKELRAENEKRKRDEDNKKVIDSLRLGKAGKKNA